MSNSNLIFISLDIEYVTEKEEWILLERNKLNQIAYFDDFDGYTHTASANFFFVRLCRV